MSTRGNPFEEMERLFERMARQFDETTSRWGESEALAWWQPEMETMSMDMVEHDEEFVVTVDMPGFTREEVDLSVTDHTLRIEGTHEESMEEEEERYLRRERHHETAHRSITLPTEVDPDGVTAKMKHGVLTITLPKLEAEESKKVDIEVE